MAGQSAIRGNQRPRELRRRVMLRARMRAPSGWSDACILNVSSRGLMINAPAAWATQGSTIELWHGEHVIVGTIVWRKGTRAGLQSDECIPVDAILADGQSAALQLTAASWPEVERRKTPRTHETAASGRGSSSSPASGWSQPCSRRACSSWSRRRWRRPPPRPGSARRLMVSLALRRARESSPVPRSRRSARR